jgi:hypothetical protein
VSQRQQARGVAEPTTVAHPQNTLRETLRVVVGSSDQTGGSALAGAASPFTSGKRRQQNLLHLITTNTEEVRNRK